MYINNHNTTTKPCTNVHGTELLTGLGWLAACPLLVTLVEVPVGMIMSKQCDQQLWPKWTSTLITANTKSQGPVLAHHWPRYQHKVFHAPHLQTQFTHVELLCTQADWPFKAAQGRRPLLCVQLAKPTRHHNQTPAAAHTPLPFLNQRCPACGTWQAVNNSHTTQ